jgi:hypothetical protein
MATGLLKSLTGIAGGMITQVYFGFLAPNTFDLLLLVALGSSSAVLLSSVLVNVVPWPVERDPDSPSRRAEVTRLSLALGGIGVLLVAVMVSALVCRALTPAPTGAPAAMCLSTPEL